MKNLLMIALVLTTITATAQKHRQKMNTDGDKDKMAMRQDLKPEESAKLKSKKLTLDLNLSATQQAEVEKIFLAEAIDNKAKIERYKAMKEKDEKPTKEERLKMTNERLDKQIAFKKKMKSVLDAEQFVKFEEMMKQREMQGKKRARGEMKGQRHRDSDHKE